MQRVSGTREIVQWHSITCEQEKIAMSLRVWNSCWKRDDPADDEEVIQRAAEVLDKLPTWTPYDGKPVCLDTFKMAVTKSKKRSMRGADKWSVREILQVPDVLLECLITLFQQIEDNGIWPTEWIRAWVLFIPKGEEVTGPESLRPITILSRLYRCWARCHAIQVIRWASQNAPPLIGGGVRGVDPVVLMLSVQFQIECATAQSPCAGLVIDITKAFNNIHRGLLLAIMRRLGVPEWICIAYAGMMSNFTRHIVLDNTVGDASRSTTGIPEGCPFAVLGMLFYTIAFSSFHQLVVPQARTYAFADNWAAIVRGIADLQAFAASLQHFCTIMKLPISAKKCWVWATERKLRKAAKCITLDGQTIALKESERELGFDMQYHGKAKHETFRKRVLKAEGKLKRVPAVPVAKKFRARLVQGAALPSVLYGTETICPSAQQVATVRTKIAKSIGCARAGENPYFALLCNRHTPLDPEYCMIIRKVKALRSMQEVTDFPVHLFLEKASTPGGRHGPARALGDALTKWGLQIDELGNIKLHNDIVINLIRDDISVVQNFLVHEWGRVVCGRVRKKRKHIDIQYIDVSHQQAMVRKLGDTAAGTVRVHINGVAYTQDRLSKFLAESSDQCPFCKEVTDSIPHRLSCKALRQHRTSCSLNVTTLQRMPETLTWHGLGHVTDEVWGFWKQMQAMPEITLPDIYENPAVVFIDGSCSDPKNPLVRLSGYSVIRRSGPYCTVTVCSGLVPGLCQTSGRAELMAGWIAIATHTCAEIYSDYKCFVQRVDFLQKGGKVNVKWVHQDLWLEIAHELNRPCKRLKILKTKAHGDWQKLNEPWREHGWLNQQADQVAKCAVQSCPREISGKFKKAQARQGAVRGMVDTYQRYIALVGQEKFDMAGNAAESADDLHDLQPLMTRRNGQTLPCDLTKLSEICQNTHWPPLFLRLIVEYFAKLEWNLEVPASCNDISWVELYIDWLMWSKLIAPARMPGSKATRPDYRWRHLDPVAQVLPSQLGKDVNTWTVAFKFLCRKGVLCAPGRYITRAQSIKRIGLHMKHGGFNQRPHLIHVLDGPQWLQKRLSRATQRTLKFALLSVPQA